MIELIKNLIEKNRNLIIYIMIGVVGAVIDLSSFYILSNILEINYIISFFIGKTLGIVNNFILNSKFNFKVNDKLFSRFLKFYSIALIGLSVGTGLMYILVDIFKFNSLLMNVFVTVFIALLQFAANRVITFKKSN